MGWERSAALPEVESTDTGVERRDFHVAGLKVRLSAHPEPAIYKMKK